MLINHAADSSNKGVFKGWRSGAGSWFDAWLTSAAAQVHKSSKTLFAYVFVILIHSLHFSNVSTHLSLHQALVAVITALKHMPTAILQSELFLQIGQVMLALPNAMANTGIRAGVPLLFMYSLFSMFTIHLLTALYAEYKARKVGS